jgi:putative photosynthetic complex assembly protein
MSHSSYQTQDHGGGAPKGVLTGAALLVLFALGASGFARISDVGTLHMPAREAVETLALRFEDRADGSIAVQDANDAHVIFSVEPGTNGFIRSTLRGLARERRRSGLDGATPFKLTHWNDGTLSLDDNATGRSVNLDAFGPSQSAAFAQLFAAGGRKP